MIFEWLNFWRTCFSVSPSMYINPFMFSICPGVILSELSSSFRSNSLGVFDKEFRDCFRCVFSIAIMFLLVPYTKPINIKKRKGIRLSASEGVQALYTQTGDTPRISRGAFICFSVYNAIFGLFACTEIS